MNEMKGKCPLTSAQITKTLKKLEKKSLIKSVKSVLAKNKKVWMLADVNPSHEVTGGILGEDVFDLEEM